MEGKRKTVPKCLKVAADYISTSGMVLGIGFEFEVIGRESTTFSFVEHFLKRDGLPITAGNRRFLDMRHPWAIDYLSK